MTTLATTEKACRGCGQNFAPRRSDQAYCSKPCQIATNDRIQMERRKRENRAKREAPVQCETCGNLFVRAKYGPARFCSPDCRQSRYRKLDTSDRTCQECGTGMAGCDPRRLFCSQKCRLKDQYRRHRPESPERFCEECGESMGRAWATRRFCSRRCNTSNWRARNREAVTEARRAFNHARRARMASAGIFEVTQRDWERMCAQYRSCCAYCGARPDRLEMDHVIPIARGGSHSIGNLVPACRACNGSKNALLLSEWRYKRERR